MNDTGFLIITSNIAIAEECLPFKLSETITISKGTEFEKTAFQKMIKDAGYFSKLIIPLGAKKSVSEIDGSVSWQSDETFTPYIILYNGFNKLIPDLELACALMQPKILLGMNGVYADTNHNSLAMYSMMSNEGLYWMGEQTQRETTTYYKKDLDELSKIFNCVVSLGGENHYKRILELYKNTTYIIRNSSLLTLSYFSILEALLTNQDGLSITKQLERKISLLFNLNGAVDHASFFGNMNSKKLWSKLYALRSNIAHGNNYEIDSSLKNFEQVNEFLELVVVKLLRFALYNQALVEDLKEC
ncbi:HEPN domain-containing protein [Klebsiella sp. BIGb0407]|uniref:HEPN domain-containing protein n=1 Tax=Klebsiella sp. BIGb0407 TaxID=2940603 RepID=UPI002169663A|nr:HEPN domain-containing protein [Klebsiella sp. BIGb0407]MCS3430251.1 hypothetical protein [Klebsiella sp. BIGb0407]